MGRNQPTKYWALQKRSHTTPRITAVVKGCQMPAHIAMHWRGGARITGQASDKPRGTKPLGVGKVFQCAGILWGFE